MLPQPLDGIEFRTVGRLTNRDNIFRPVQLIRQMSTCPVYLHDDNAIGIASRELVNELSEVLCIESVKTVEVPFTGQWFHQSIEPKGLSSPVVDSFWFDAFEK